MTNFDFLSTDPQFSGFADVAIAAELMLPIDTAACVFQCRRSMEFAVRWMYSVDKALSMPYQDNLYSLMGAEEFRDIVGKDIWRRMDLIRKLGNRSAHDNTKKVTEEQAKLCLYNLFIFFDFIACCYATEYEAREYDESLLGQTPGMDEDPAERDAFIKQQQSEAVDTMLSLEALLAENQALKDELSKRRSEQQQHYVAKPLEQSEYNTRKIYIDALLVDAGWTEGKDWINEVELQGMPNSAGVGYADYVLYGTDGKALAVVEAKRTCVSVEKGRQKASLYADILEDIHGRRPVIFLTNGFETRIIDGQYPERKTAAIYSKRDLEKWFNLRGTRSSLKYIEVDREIAGRYYQEAAVKAVCSTLDEKNRRKALVVMATGSGKTRTVIALVDVLMKNGWIKNVLFLADRTALVTQAKRSFTNLIGDKVSSTNLCEKKADVNARVIFSTYQTMLHCIDTVRDEEGKLFTTGHFDLVICDEAHRSIYRKYQNIFTYFDAPLIGLTATPKDEVDKNTYDVFELEQGVPTYGYELAQAVKDGFLVDFRSVEAEVKFIEEGIVYADLSEEEKEEYEKTFSDENGEYPERIESAALNKWLFNKDTIRKVLRTVLADGLKVDYGQKIGKTIIFAKNHAHAEKIFEVFNEEFPHLNGYAKVIDNYIEYAQSAIDEFSEAKKLPQIAISVDMLDTGIDIPEILNLVFFKKVFSKAKFWQMIGRGTRLCEGLVDGEDKQFFYIFDFCGNFRFFRMNEGRASANTVALQSAIFSLKFEIAWKLQNLDYQTEVLAEFRQRLVDEMSEKVRELDRENFAVRQHLKYVDLYANSENYKALTYEDTLVVKEELAPLILPSPDDVSAVRFDALLYGIELAYLAGKKYTRAHNDLIRRVDGIAGVANIPEIRAHADLLNRILHTNYLEGAGINEFEHIRENLRDLMKYLPVVYRRYDTDFRDDILNMEIRDSELENDDLKNYKEKAAFYVREHQDRTAIAKLRSNIPLNSEDVRELETILWSEAGTEEDYHANFGEKPLGEFVREIVGLDMRAAKEAFAAYLDDTSLDSRQIYFVNQIVEFIVRNGMMKDLSVLQETPFTDRGSIVEIFTDTSVWMGIRKTIEEINANALAA